MIRKIKRKFGISAPRLAVRLHVPWYVRWAIVIPFVLAVSALVWWAYDSGLELAGFHRGQAEQELTTLRGQVTSLKIENASLFSQSATFERQAQIEHAANIETGNQLKALQDDNARIKEDLAFFQSLTLSGNQKTGLSIHQVKVEHDTLPGEYRYRLLLVQSGTRRAQAFHGKLRLLVNTLQNGKPVVMTFPKKNATDDEAYQLSFKYYQRVESNFQLPPDALVKSIQVRVFARGSSAPKIKQDVNLS